jgi:prepilin-type N-terminal cleavage/methylation domain-containing protein
MRSNFPTEFGQRSRPRRRKSAASRGFSLVELVMVIAVALIAMAIAMPIMLNSVNAARVRNQMSDVSGIVQACRSRAVHENATQHLIISTDAPSGETVLYVDNSSDPPPALTTTVPQVWMPRNLLRMQTPPTVTPTPLDSTIMWGDGLGVTPASTDDLCFNSRGIPCQCPTGLTAKTAYCGGITNGYAYYFTLTSQPGGTRWAAIGISPAGRIKTFFWDGYKWSD